MAQMVARCPTTAYEARLMLQRIKLDNMRRSQELVTAPPSPRKAAAAYNVSCQVQPNRVPYKVPNSPNMAQNKFVKVNSALEMGSFTSKSIVRPLADTDEEVNFDHIEDLKSMVDLCSENMKGLPEPIKRSWRKKSNPSIRRVSTAGLGKDGATTTRKNSALFESSISDEAGGPSFTENVRVLQWNALSQTLGTKNDNFVKCPKSALDWRTRKFRMLEEIVQYDADVICLQEVDHFKYFQRALSCLNYQGHFFPKPDSPCIYLPENSGPDGCAIFFKKDKFSLRKLESRVIEVWRVQSNQVVLSAILKSKLTGEELMVATTHLKARKGPLLSTLRNEQGKDLLQYLKQEAGGRPVIVSGDFNAEPTEPVYNTMIEGEGNMRFQSAYAEVNDGVEVPYTTWKIREDGEHIQTLDYIFHTPGSIEVDSVLEFPTGEEIGQNRLPSPAYASDHFSLACNFKIRSTKTNVSNQDQQREKSKH